MNSADIFRTLFAYDAALWQRIWRLANDLPLEAFERPVTYGVGSLRNHLAHVALINTRWLNGLDGDPEAIRYEFPPEVVATRESIQAASEAASARALAFVATLTDEDLDQTPPTMEGPLWQVLFHFVNHGTDHRAQVLRILNELGAPTFPQDYIMYQWFPSLE